MSAGDGLDLRPATGDDYEAVAAFTADTWPDRAGSDYIPRVYHDWIEGPDRETFVLEAGTELAGICQGVRLTDHEAWAQGLRVAPAHRGRGVGRRLSGAVLDWARERGAAVCRNMVFSWNVAGLGHSRAVGFEPATEFRWAHPEPDPDPDPGSGPADPGLAVREAPDAAWSWFARSGAAERLGRLALDLEESWALAELTRDRLRRAADDGRVLALVGEAGTRGMTYRVRTTERANGDGATERLAEYGVAAWADPGAARVLCSAIARDAAAVGADRTRVLVPESVRHASDLASARAGLADEPDFVLAADLTGARR